MTDEARFTLGGNLPPLTPFELSAKEAEDLLSEACNWVDGMTVESQEQADALSGLRGQIKAAIKRADERRKEEARPHDEAKSEIQARYNTLIGDTKTTGKGKLILADDACQRAITPWLKKLDGERRAAAAKAAEEAEAKRRAAAEAFAKSTVDDLDARQQAEKAAAEAVQATKAATKAERQATTGTGLRTTYSGRLTDLQAFARWSWGNDLPALSEHFEARANALVKAGRRDLPGVEVVEHKEAR